jgi:hypothetical protein
LPSTKEELEDEREPPLGNVFNTVSQPTVTVSRRDHRLWRGTFRFTGFCFF